ncbi:MAG: HWE histidine kinase domain-containing protein [Phenylobacterium sp.]
MADGSSGTGRDGPAPELIAALGAAMLQAPWQEGLIVCDADWRITYLTAAGGCLLGLTSDGVGDLLWRRQTALVGGVAELQLRRAMSGQEAVEFVIEAPVGEDAWLEVRALPLSGATAFLLRDVTERERGERRLRRMNANLRLAHAAARAASWSWRKDQPLRWIDPDAARRLLGLPPTWNEEIESDAWMRRIAPEGRVRMQAALRRLGEVGEAVFELQLGGADGVERWLETRAQVVERAPSGEALRVIGVTLDVTSRLRAEAALRAEISERQKAEAHQKLLINELNHRVKNTLASVQSIARQTLRRQAEGAALELFDSRLQALAWTHDVLTGAGWTGAWLDELVRKMVSPHEGDGMRFECAGAPVRVSPQMALALSMGLHELATNAVKYGALSNARGRVKIDWSVSAKAGERPVLTLRWRESGGPPVKPPKRRGFGSRLIERGLSAELGESAQLTFAPAGLRCTIRARLD